MEVVLMGGGLDSAVLLFDRLQHDPNDLKAMWFDYGQKNAKYEKKATMNICTAWGIPLMQLDVKGVFKNVPSSLLASSKDEHSVASDEIVHRNTILVHLALQKLKDYRGTLYIGAHKTSAPYVDCTARYYGALNHLLKVETNSSWSVEVPYIRKAKHMIVKRGWDLGMTKQEFAATVSCYEGTNCGKCPACLQRAEAFKKIGIL